MQNSEELENLKGAKKNINLEQVNKKTGKKIITYLLLITFIINLLMIFIVVKNSSNEDMQYINHRYNYNITPIDPNVPKRKIYVKYMDFWPSFKIDEFDIHNILKERYQVIQSENPDYIFFGNFGLNNIGLENKFDCIKIFLSIENLKPDFSNCDYAIGLHYINRGDRYCRKPTDTSMLTNIGSIYNLTKIKNIDIKNKKFCAWVVSNEYGKERNLFYEKLSKYKKIDSGGKFKNNIGYRVKNKIDFLKNYKFSICFENSKKDGYISEKLFDAFEAGTIPIYFGDDSVTKLINNRAYIHIKNKYDFDKKIELIKKIDQDDNLYNSIIKEKIVLNDSNYEPELIKYRNFIYHIIEQDKQKAKRFTRKN